MSFSDFIKGYSERVSGEQEDEERIHEARNLAGSLMHDPEIIEGLISFLDLTKLNATDTFETVRLLAHKGMKPAVGYDTRVAAVCVYPNRVRYVKEELDGSGIKVASVAGGFPSGMTSTKVKVEEVKYAIDMGADEIDLVICRGDLLEGAPGKVYDEVSAVKEMCGQRSLKVIIETCDLETPEMVRLGSMTALYAGADLIKTSTGKGKSGATPEHALVMLDAISEFHRSTGKKTGFKPAGGISDVKNALLYWSLVQSVLGDEWLDPGLFRIGASSLLDDIITHTKNAG